MKEKLIFTLGHSTRTTQEFLEILDAFSIEVLVDIRHYPGSRYCPQFKQAVMEQYLTEHNINYLHLVDLGGRRKPDKSSNVNAGWRSDQFRGYADYMQTEHFSKALAQLIKIADQKRTAIMCSEAVVWRCHRSMVADALLLQHFLVYDIFSKTKALPHQMTVFAKVSKGKLTYPAF